MTRVGMARARHFGGDIDDPGSGFTIGWPMRIAVSSSVMTHLAVLIIAQFGLPGTCTRPEVAAHHVPVALVSTEELAALFAAAEPLPPPLLEPLPQPLPPVAELIEPALPQMPDPPPEASADAQDGEIAAPVEPEPELEPEPEPDIAAEIVAPPEEAIDIPLEPEANDADVLALLNEISGERERPSERFDPTASDIDLAQFTPDELEQIEALKLAIIAQVSRCWRPPEQMSGADRLLVEVHVQFAVSGAVNGVAVFDSDRMMRDPTFRAAGEAAKNAFLDPVCNPLTLPAEQYGLWHEIIFTFNPSEMVN